MPLSARLRYDWRQVEGVDPAGPYLEGTHRFGELKRQTHGITQTMLTNQLRALEADGLVARKVAAEVRTGRGDGIAPTRD